MRCRVLCVLLAILALAPAASARAHFLFLRIGAHAEAGRSAEVYFSEYAEAGDPRFIEKIAHTQLWLQSEPGKFAPLVVRKGADRLRAFLPSSPAIGVVGQCEYGVLTREVPFLLRYYPKAIAGLPEGINALKPREAIPLEIMAEAKDDAVALTLLHHGKPVPDALLTTIDADLVNEELKTDKSGRASWKPPGPGLYSIYSKMVTPEAGEQQGKRYTEIREFATLSFHWPLARTQADPAAVEMFQKAIAARSSWQNFPGFSAAIKGTLDGRPFSGTIRIDAQGEVTHELDDEAAADWVEDQLGSIVLHRKASSSSAPSKPPVLYFADRDTTHPLGRLLAFVGGQFASSYRVRGDEIVVVNRNLGSQNMTITVLENSRNGEGKVLPRAYTVQYWDAKDGQLLRTENVQNSWVKVGDLDLPESETITVASSSGLSVRSFRLAEHKLLEK